MKESRYRSEIIGRQHVRTDFRCGVDALDQYFHRYALKERRRSVAAPYVFVETSAGAVVGFYTLSSSSIPRGRLQEEFVRGMPKYQNLPVILLGRFAVDERWQHQGIGTLLLYDALSNCLDASQKVGVIGILVEAKDERVCGFYERHLFVPLVDARLTLFMPMATVAALLA